MADSRALGAAADELSAQSGESGPSSPVAPTPPTARQARTRTSAEEESPDGAGRPGLRRSALSTEQAARRGPWLLAAAHWKIQEERRQSAAYMQKQRRAREKLLQSENKDANPEVDF